ncbi:hypothetical protein MARHY2294 [Marinobacter nauticus ATCC 49840]|uniref:hypothetical protein n=1 Tax=Marinobacter nauticus TaxID=2743 RepID=UPI000256F0A5|nr:hypothetical protein [Marinobacter nauticus]CCG95768.1 hypothetical protein MARHY2294 [Marinobacter nauticus ATCC 49840]
MNELSDRKKELEAQVHNLAPIVQGLKKALKVLALSNDDQEVLSRLYETNKAVYEESRKELKKIKKSIKPKKSRQTRQPPKTVDQIKLSYRKRVAEKIQEIHKISGFNRRRPKIVQGGAPGLGKKS